MFVMHVPNLVLHCTVGNEIPLSAAAVVDEEEVTHFGHGTVSGNIVAVMDALMSVDTVDYNFGVAENNTSRRQLYEARRHDYHYTYNLDYSSEILDTAVAAATFEWKQHEQHGTAQSY